MAPRLNGPTGLAPRPASRDGNPYSDCVGAVTSASQRVLSAGLDAFELVPFVGALAPRLRAVPALATSSAALASASLEAVGRFLGRGGATPRTAESSVPAPEVLDRWLRAGLPLELALRNPGFREAVLATHLHKRLAFYGHDVPTDPSGEPLIRFRGVLTPWREIERHLSVIDGRLRSRGASGEPETYWDYLENGLEPWNYLGWTTLRPFRTLPERERPKTPMLDVVTRVSDFHAWIRLTTTAGEVYSVGLRAYDKPITGNYGPIARSTRAQIACPDIEEFLADEDTYTVRIPITDEKLLETKAELERYQALGLHFNYVDHNCSTLTAQIVSQTVEPLSVETSLLGFLMPEAMRAFIEANVPGAVRDTIGGAVTAAEDLGPNVAANLLLALAGGLEGVDGAPGSDERNLGAIFESPWQIIGPSRLRISTPALLKAWQERQSSAGSSRPRTAVELRRASSVSPSD